MVGIANASFTGTNLALLCSRSTPAHDFRVATRPGQRSPFTGHRLPASITHDRSRSWIETSTSLLGNHGSQLGPQDLARELLEPQPRVKREVPGHSPKGRQGKHA